MKTETELQDTIFLCSGTLTTWLKSQVLDAYGEVPEIESEFWAVFERDGTRTEIRSAEMLYRVLCAQGGDLSADASPVAGRLAELTAFLLGRLRAITDPELYSFLERFHPIFLTSHLPRVEGHDFRFLLVDFSEGRTKPAIPGSIVPINFAKSRLFEITVDLETGAIRRDPLYRAAQTESFVTFSLCGGALTGWRQVDAADAGNNPIPRSKIWAVFKRDGNETEIHSAEELYRILSAQACDLPTEVASATVGLAHLTAVLLGRFRAVTDLKWNSHLEMLLRLTFSIRDELPRVDGSLFRFLVVDLSTSYRKGCLHGVEIDLRTGVITRQPRS